MLLFTTTTLINSLSDYTTGKTLVTGDATNKILTVLRQGQYKVDDDHKICLYRTVGHAAYKDVIDLSGVTGLTANTLYRLKLYIRSIGNADPLFSNSYVFKGRPVYVEFNSGADATAAKKNLVDNLNKYLNVVNDSAMLLPAATLNGSISGTTSTVLGVATDPTSTTPAAYIVAANEYMRITEAVIQKYVDMTDTNKTDSWTDEIDLVAGSNVATGTEGFGNYAHLEKDFRLPTAANLRWKRTMADEMPIAGKLYNEYILHYTVNRGQVAGMGAVGQTVTSETTHVFWVNQDVDAAFKAEIEKVFTVDYTTGSVANKTAGE